MKYSLIILGATILGAVLGQTLDFLNPNFYYLGLCLALSVLVFTLIGYFASRLFDLPEGLILPRLIGAVRFGLPTGVIAWVAAEISPMDPGFLALGVFCGACAGLSTAISFGLRGDESRPFGQRELENVVSTFIVGLLIVSFVGAFSEDEEMDVEPFAGSLAAITTVAIISGGRLGSAFKKNS